MAQLHFYVPDDVAKRIQEKAKETNLSVSRYLAEIVKREAGGQDQWPEGYFELFGSWEGEHLVRSPQGEYEDRPVLK